MRIVENTPDRLVIKDRPFFTAALLWVAGGAATWFGFMMWGGPFLAFPIVTMASGLILLLLAWRCLPTITVILDRTSNKVTWRATRLTGRTHREMAMRDVHAAGIYRSLFGTGGLRRVALNPKAEAFSLEYGLIGLRRRKLIAEINTWLGLV